MPERQTRIFVTDARVIVVGHASNRAACIAVSAAVQTFARVVGMLGMLSEAVELDEATPRYAVVLEDGADSRKAISGLMSAFAGIAAQCPGALLVSDNRTRRDTFDVVEAVKAQNDAAPVPSLARAILKTADGYDATIVA